MISEEFARQQVNRMQGLPYFNKIGQAGYQELVNTLRRTAQDEREAEAGITAILGDENRAQDRFQDKVPSPGELKQWVLAQRTEQQDTSPRDTRYCDRCRDGRPPGWITIPRTVRGQVYDFAGKCPACYPGWYGKAEE